MRSAEAFRVAVTALRANRLRSVLTMIGVIIGVGSVVLLVAIGSGARQEVEDQVSGLGANLVFVVPGRLEFGTAPSVSPLELEDVERLGRVVGNPEAVAASVSSGETASFGSAESFVTVVGANENLPAVLDRPIGRGEYFTATDVDTRRRVAVLGANTSEQLFGGIEPLGRQIVLGGVRFRVIGVFSDLGSSFGVNRNAEIHVPITAAQRLFGVDRVDLLTVKAPTSEDVEETQDVVLASLREAYPDDEVSALTQSQILGTLGQILGVLTLVLAAIAAISLLVGGVGVSNIMLVSVRERTREIGLRKALGARQRDILSQFLVEAVLLTTLGGLIGIAIGVGSAALVGQFSPIPAQTVWWSPALAFGVSVAVGVIFGVAPARRAGKLDPVVALRSE